MSPRKALLLVMLPAALVAGCGGGPTNEFVLHPAKERAARQATAQRERPDEIAALERDRLARHVRRWHRLHPHRPYQRKHHSSRSHRHRETKQRQDPTPHRRFHKPRHGRPEAGSLPVVVAPAPPAPPRPATLEGEAAARELHLAGDAVRRYVSLLDAHDPAVCTELMTLGLVETITHRQGDAAIAKCRQDIGSSVSRVSLVGFGAGRAMPDRAYVEYTTQVNFVRHTSVARLLKVGAGYVLDGDGSRDVERLG
jgi:hypothetical protein